MLKFKIKDTNKTFSFECDATKLSGALSKAVNVTSFSNAADNEKHHLLVSYKKHLYVVAFSPDTFVAFCLEDVETSDNGAFAFNPQTLQGLIKKRKGMKFRFNNGRLDFKQVSGNYSGKIETYNIDSGQIGLVNSKFEGSDSNSVSLGSEALSSLREGIKVSNLQNFYGSDPIVCMIRANSGNLEVSAYDNFHMSHYRSKVSKDLNFQLSIQVSTFRLIDKFVSDEDEDVQFFIGDRLTVFGSSYTVDLPSIQVDDEDYNRVRDYIDSLKNHSVQLKFTSAGVATVDNMFTISDADTRLSMSLKKDRVGISMETESGKVSDAFKTLVDMGMESMSFMIDPRIFGDLFDKVREKEEIPMRLYQKKNSGVSSCFVIANSTKHSKTYLVGTYYEE